MILDEILMHADEPSDLARRRRQTALFPDHPLGHARLGTAPPPCGDLGRDDIHRFFEHHYRPGNIVVSAAGDCTHDQLAAQLEDRFSGSGGRRGARPRSAPGPDTVRARRGAPADRAGAPGLRDARHRSHFDERGGRRPSSTTCWAAACRSRLFQKVREERGWPTRCGPSGRATTTPVSMAVVAGTAPEHVGEVLRIVTEELESLATDGVSDRELSVAKGNLRAELLLAGRTRPPA